MYSLVPSQFSELISSVEPAGVRTSQPTAPATIVTTCPVGTDASDGRTTKSVAPFTLAAKRTDVIPGATVFPVPCAAVGDRVTAFTVRASNAGRFPCGSAKLFST